MTKDEALKQIAGFTLSQFMGPHDMALACVDIARKTLAQPEQEPCRHRIVDVRNEAIKSGYMCMDCGALFGAYTTPPQRKPLTDEQVDILAFDEGGLPNSHLEFARAIEAAHGIKE